MGRRSMLGFLPRDKHAGMLPGMKHCLPLAFSLLLVACGDNDDGDDNTPPIDSATDSPTSDGPDIDAPIDGPAIDAPIDAPSSVQVIPNCTGIPVGQEDHVITVSMGSAFSPQNSTIQVNDVVRFEPGGFHDIDSPGNFDTPPNQVSCLRFTAAGTFPIQCSIHQFTGSITVTN